MKGSQESSYESTFSNIVMLMALVFFMIVGIVGATLGYIGDFVISLFAGPTSTPGPTARRYREELDDDDFR